MYSNLLTLLNEDVRSAIGLQMQLGGRKGRTTTIIIISNSDVLKEAKTYFPATKNAILIAQA